jgi:hypothetical protein
LGFANSENLQRPKVVLASIFFQKSAWINFNGLSSGGWRHYEHPYYLVEELDHYTSIMKLIASALGMWCILQDVTSFQQLPLEPWSVPHPKAWMLALRLDN